MRLSQSCGGPEMQLIPKKGIFVPVKKLLVIFLLAAYFFSTTELGQLLKIPVLISHFIEHKEHDKGMTFWGYLVHHYGGHEKDADWETDMKLPFMRHADVLTILIVPPDSPDYLSGHITDFSISRQVVCYQDGAVPSSHLQAIWQPPKFC